jgi:hypothetical protein
MIRERESIKDIGSAFDGNQMRGRSGRRVATGTDTRQERKGPRAGAGSRVGLRCCRTGAWADTRTWRPWRPAVIAVRGPRPETKGGTKGQTRRRRRAGRRGLSGLLRDRSLTVRFGAHRKPSPGRLQRTLPQSGSISFRRVRNEIREKRARPQQNTASRQCCRRLLRGFRRFQRQPHAPISPSP